METITTPRTRPDPHGTGFRHDALFYAGLADFVDRTGAFLRDAVEAGEPTLVVVSAEKIELLREALGDAPEGVRFADMATVGANPARIIPAWRDFVDQHAPSGRRFRGIGEPIWAARSADELAECARHEALLNLAFAGAPAWWLACPYDIDTLPRDVLEEAERNHPFLVDGAGTRGSRRYRGLDDVARPFDEPLPEPGGSVRSWSFPAAGGDLGPLRARVRVAAAAFGMDAARADDLILVVNEAATNSVRHGGGGGVLRIWERGSSLICEVRDAGRIDDPLVGRGRPRAERGSGFGLWLANQLCDLVQIRAMRDGSVVRLHVAR